MTGTDTHSEFQLKRPILVYLLAVGFMLAPLGNILMGLYLTGSEQWWNPSAWGPMLAKQDALYFVLLVAIFMAGLALTIQKKTSWFFAICVLMAISFRNFFYFDGSPNLSMSPGVIPIILNTSVLVILFFFRYPYLDKRDHIFKGHAERFPVELLASIEGIDSEATITSLSRTGCFVQLKKADLLPDVGTHLKISIGSDLKATVQVMYFLESGFGARFIALDREQKMALDAALNKHKHSA